MTFEAKKQANKHRRRGAQQISELISAVIDPLLQKRAGINTQLVLAWEDIVGQIHAGYTRPEKLEWPRAYGDDDVFKPATLKIACDGARAIYVQHEAGQIIDRVNTFFGFIAVDRIRIVQKPVHTADNTRRPQAPPLDHGQQRHLDDILSSVEDETLRKRLHKLGDGVFRRGSSKPG